MSRLLLVDDEASILAAMAEYFSALGYEVHCAADEPAARALIARYRYAVVITDLRLSCSEPLAGVALLERVRQRSPTTARIVLTAQGCTGTGSSQLRDAATVVLQKPQALATVAAIAAALVGQAVRIEDSEDASAVAARG